MPAVLPMLPVFRLLRGVRYELSHPTQEDMSVYSETEPPRFPPGSTYDAGGFKGTHLKGPISFCSARAGTNIGEDPSISCFPLPLKDGDGSPVRAVAWFSSG